jgi:uncharacterized membrane protein YccC
MSSAAASPHRSLSPAIGAFFSAVRRLPSDGAFRYGIKFGLAGVLAVFLALLNRNPQPTWALFTVFVLMGAQYLGAIAEKSLLRMVGTVIGGFTGYLLTAAFQQDPLIYLSLLALFVAFCTAMFGQGNYPYAFLLCGMTAVVVCSNGLTDPDQSWRFMIWRIQEVGIGIGAVMLVQSLVWPRYAAEEFLTHLRCTFTRLRDMLAEPLHRETPASDSTFEERIASLRQLLRFGARESRYFVARLEPYIELTGCLRRIHSAIRTLREGETGESFYLEKCHTEFQELHTALELALEEIACPQSSRESRRRHAETLDAAAENMRQAILRVRQLPGVKEVDLQEATDFSLQSLSLDEIRLELSRCVALLDGLPRQSQTRSTRSLRALLPGLPADFWITNGIRSALAAVTALVLMDWLNPPGGVMMVLGAWAFCALLPNAPEGRGDRRAWNVAVIAILCLGGTALLLLATTPLLAIYAVMNTVIFTWLFVYGHLSYRIPGVSAVMNISMMAMVGILGLNAQQPVAFQSVVHFFFGLSLALLIAALFQRTLWPLLPQHEVRTRFLSLLAIHLKGLETVSISTESRFRLALLPGEIVTGIRHLTPPVCPPGESERLLDLLDLLDRYSANRIPDSDFSAVVPPEDAATAREMASKIRRLFSDILQNISLVFSSGQPVNQDPAPLQAGLEEFDSWLASLRLRLLEKNHAPPATVRILGLAARHRHAARDLAQAAVAASQLRPSLYMGDASL